MNKKRIMIIMVLFVVLSCCVILGTCVIFGRVLCGSIEELNCVAVRYYDFQVDGYYREIRITEKNDMKKLYNTIKNAECKKFILSSDASSEPDPGWEVTFEFTTGIERFDNTVSSDIYGIRKYISTPFSDGYIFLSSEEVHDLINEIISKDIH